MIADWNTSLVLLSLLIAVIGSFSALIHAQRMRVSSGWTAGVWMLVGGMTLGLAIWSTHFIGMLAYHLPIAIGYDWSLTLLSAVPAMATAMLGFYVLRVPRINRWPILASSVLMGLGISAMHYTGMAAIKMSPPISHDPLFVMASILMAMVAAMGALLLMYQGERIKMQTLPRLTLSSVILGLAICAMHYTAMLGVHIMPNSICLTATTGIGRGEPELLVALVSLLWFGGGLLAALFDYRMARQNAQALAQLKQEHGLLQTRAEQQFATMTQSLRVANERLQMIFEHSPDAVIISDGLGQILFANDCSSSWLGFSHDELLRMSVFDLAPPDWRERYRDDFTARAASGQSWLREVRLIKKSGDRMALEMHAVRLPDASVYFSFRDATERHQAERELRIAAIAFETQEAIMITDSAHMILRVNRAFCDITGYAPDEVIGRTPKILQSGRHDAAFYQEMHDKLESAGRWFGEIWDKRKNGEIYPKWLSISTVHTLAGDVSHYVATFVDITEHIKNRVQLAESERFTRATLDALDSHIAVLDSTGRIILTNAAWRRFAQQNGQIAATVSEGADYLAVCQQATAPNDEGAATAARLISDLISGRRMEGHFEYPCHAPRGERWFACRGTRFAGDGPVHVVMTHQNITARKRAQEALRQLNQELETKVQERTDALQQSNMTLLQKEEEIRSVVENLVDCVISIDSQGIIQSANLAVEHVLGYGVDEVLGRNVSMLMPKPHQGAHDAYLERYCRTGQAHIIGIGREVEGLHKNGTRIAMELSVNEYFAHGQRFFTGILRDIRHRVRIMKDLEQARLAAEQASQAKSAFLAAMSHEIRTPMNGVVGMVDVLHQTSLQSYQVEIVNTIRDSAYALLAIVEDILDFSKIEAGKLELEQTAMSVSSVVAQVCSMMDHVAQKKEVTLTLFIDPEIPEPVLGDALRLRQVLINLISNAIKFSSGAQRPGQVSLRVCLSGRSMAGVSLTLAVRDNGIGMDEAAQAQLFTSFSQADVSTTRRFGGTGLGLAISSQLVQLMGGTIMVQSAPDQGSAFTVHLPFEVPLIELETCEVASPIAGLSCLVVGPMSGLADDLVVYLKHGGAAVGQVSALAQARELTSTTPADLSVWLIDAAGDAPTAEQLRVAAASRSDQVIRFVVIGRGYRRQPRATAPDMVSLDGNVLYRHTLLKAVAMAAGRASDDIQAFEQAEAPFGPMRATVSRPSYELAQQQGRLILVAEDNETNQLVIRHQFNLLGYTADIVADGDAALTRWRSGHYAMLLTDLHMPEMDGYQLATTIRAEEKEKGLRHLPIVAFSANAMAGEAQRCYTIGMDDYLSKPTPLTKLQAILNKWVPIVEATSSPRLAVSWVTQAPAAPTLDIKVLHQLVGNEPLLVSRFLLSFQASAIKSAAALRDACQGGQASAASAAAHKLKSAARAVGAMALGELCDRLEQAGSAGDQQALLVLLPAFEQELNAVANALNGLLPQHQPPTNLIRNGHD